jgi:hypothetical protein
MAPNPASRLHRPALVLVVVLVVVVEFPGSPSSLFDDEHDDDNDDPRGRPAPELGAILNRLEIK